MSKLIPFLFLILTQFVSIGQEENKLKGKPNSVSEALLYLDQKFSDTTKYGFMYFPEDIAVSRLHFGFGMWMRNNWGLWRGGKLKDELIAMGFTHPDDMSSFILTAYHRKLHGKEIDGKSEAAKSKEFMLKVNQGISFDSISESGTSNDVLIDLFNEGDTIQFSVLAERKRFGRSYSSSVKALGVIIEKQSDSLHINLYRVAFKKRYVAQYIVGDTLITSPYYCKLLPPKGWKPKY